MSIKPRTLGQGVTDDLARCLGSRGFAHRPFDDGEYEAFEDCPEAPFLVTEVTRNPERWGADRPGALMLQNIYRSGYRCDTELPGFRSLGRSIALGQSHIKRWPELAADARPDDSPCLLVPESLTPIVSEFVYIHAPGSTVTMGVYGARIYKQCDFKNMDTLGAYTIDAFQRMQDDRRGFEREYYIGSATKDLPFPPALLATQDIPTAELGVRYYSRRRLTLIKG